MHPVLVKLFWMGKDIVISTYGVMMIAGMAAGALLSFAVARRHGYGLSEFFNYGMLIMAGIIGGSLLVGFIIFLPERAGKGYIDYPTALVSWGGILGGMAAIGYIKYSWKQRFLLIADIITPGYLLGLGIGRIGCFFAGCCYGVHTPSCIGITFTDTVAPATAMEQPLVPTQLISAAFLVCAGVSFIPLALRRKLTGFTFALSAVVYSIFRFTIEFWRDDPRLFFLGLSDGQIFSIGYFVMGVIMMIYVFSTSPPNPLSNGRGRAGGGVRS